ncbi:MAG: hypothetical protein RIB67_07310 [Miltoncostaeaceae bacterium]
MADDAPTPFTQFLLALRGGDAHHELTEALADLTSAVMESGRAGSLSFTVKIKPAAKGGNAVLITDSTALKRPAANNPEALFFAGDGGRLSRNDPRQPELPLREAGGPTPIRESKENTR